MLCILVSATTTSIGQAAAATLATTGEMSLDEHNAINTTMPFHVADDNNSDQLISSRADGGDGIEMVV